ncbi:hypothetical protein [Cysteiniphilum litorale]|uniref:hypothetical protein n=1 Tax=Cysteiniphilum litorale TaxID=2056700 RepID=UPI003F8824CF
MGNPFKKNLLHTLLFAAAATGFANANPIRINNNTDTPLAYDFDLYHDTSMTAGSNQQGIINPKSSIIASINADFWEDSGDDYLSTVFCAGATPDHDRGVSDTDCSVFGLDLFPNLINNNDVLNESPLTVDFTGNENPDDYHSFAVNGFSGSDSQYTLSYGYNCSQSHQGVPMSDTIDILGVCNIDVNVDKVINTSLPSINTMLVHYGDGESGYVPEDHNLYRIEIERAKDNQLAVSPPLNGIFYQVQTLDNKFHYFYPTTGVIYNQNGTVTPNNFSFYLSLPKSDKTAVITECTSDFVAQNNSNTPVCHHQIWHQTVQFKDDTNIGSYNKADAVTLSPIDQQKPLYSNGSFALPVMVTVKDRTGHFIPPTDPVYQHLVFIDNERSMIITNDISNQSGVAIVSADNAWLHGLIGNDNYAAKYTYTANIKKPNDGKMFYLYSTSATDIHISAVVCGYNGTVSSCNHDMSSLPNETSIPITSITNDANTIYSSNDKPSSSRTLTMRNAGGSYGCGNLENPNTPALNYVMNSDSLPNSGDNIPYGAYYLLPGLSDCDLKYSAFCNGVERKDSGYFGRIRYYLQDDHNNSMKFLNSSYLGASENCANTNYCTHDSNQLWTNQLQLSDLYDYADTWQGKYAQKDTKGDRAILFDNCGRAARYVMSTSAPDRTTPSSGSNQYQGQVVFVNDFPYPITLRFTSLSDNEIEAFDLGDGIVIGSHNAARISMANEDTPQETVGIEIDNIAGVKLFSYNLTSAVFKQADGNPYTSHGLLGSVAISSTGPNACSTPVYIQALYKQNGGDEYGVGGDAVGQAVGMVVMMPYTKDVSKFNQVNDFRNNMLLGNSDVLRTMPYTCTPDK